VLEEKVIETSKTLKKEENKWNFGVVKMHPYLVSERHIHRHFINVALTLQNVDASQQMSLGYAVIPLLGTCKSTRALEVDVMLAGTRVATLSAAVRSTIRKRVGYKPTIANPIFGIRANSSLSLRKKRPTRRQMKKNEKSTMILSNITAAILLLSSFPLLLHQTTNYVNAYVLLSKTYHVGRVGNTTSRRKLRTPSQQMNERARNERGRIQQNQGTLAMSLNVARISLCYTSRTPKRSAHGGANKEALHIFHDFVTF